MRRSIAILLAVGLGTSLAATPSRAANLAPVSYRIISGCWKCCIYTDLCEQFSRDVEALSERDGVCVSFDADPNGNTVKVELVFNTTLGPGPFLLRLVADGAWHEVQLMNWSTAEFDELLMVPSADEATSSGIASADHVDPASGAIVVRISATFPDPLVRDEKTLDEVEIVIPPP